MGWVVGGYFGEDGLGFGVGLRVGLRVVLVIVLFGFYFGCFGCECSFSIFRAI